MNNFLLFSEVWIPIHRGLASVSPNGDSGAFFTAGVMVGAIEANVNGGFNCQSSLVVVIYRHNSLLGGVGRQNPCHNS